MSDATACLYVVATPIGNLDDVSARACSVLAEVDLIVAEDTRVTRRLLDRHAISADLLSLGSHNEARSTDRALAALGAGRRVALVSDAGTPLLSDPGFELVRAAHRAGIPVRAVPGPSAITAALSVCGLPAQPFWFEGFLPARAQARRARLAELADVAATLVLFEAPHRVRASLDDLCQVLGGMRAACAARELTKLHEEVRGGTLESLARWFDEHPPRGEFVLLVEGARATPREDAWLRQVLEPLLAELPLRQAVSLAVKITGEPRNRIYPLALTLQAD